MPDPIQVTADNFIRAESDLYFSRSVAQGGFGRLHHFRSPSPVDRQTVVRMNRDTIYSSGVCDLDAGPATVIMPEAGGRFMSLQVFDEDEYVHGVYYGAGSHIFSKEEIGTRYAMFAVRTLIDAGNPADIAEANRLQDAIRIGQPGIGRFEIPNWDPASQKKVREALLTLGETVPDSRHMFGRRDEVDPIRHLIGAAGLWGGNPEADAVYLNVTPTLNDGKTVYRLTVREVPVDGFWSVIVYNAEGYIPANAHNVYSLNNITAKTDADGSVTVQFGGYDGRTPNCLPIVPGWNYMVRLYRPRPEILRGRWVFPQAQPVQ